MLSHVYTTAVATLACIYLICPCIESAAAWEVWWFNEGILSSVYEPYGDYPWAEKASNIGITHMGKCNSSKSCVDLTISDDEWIIEQTSLQNMKGFDQLSQFLFTFWAGDTNATTKQCTISWKFDTQSTYQIAEGIRRTDENNGWKDAMIPIDHNATTLLVKLDSEGCSSGGLLKFKPDGQCKDDGDECIYVIGMDDGNATDYVQEWHQDGCLETHPVYVRESNDINDSDHEYLCNIGWDWFATDQKCSDFLSYEGFTGRCIESPVDIFGCSGRSRFLYDAGVLQFHNDGDRYSTKLIVGCSEIDLFAAESEDPSSVCVQLEMPTLERRPWGLGYYRFDNSKGDNHYATFAKTDNYSKNGKAIYMYDGDDYHYQPYYVFSDGDRWIMSFETIRLEGTWGSDEIKRSESAIVCNEDNLMDCTQHKWSINGTIIDRIKVFAGECDANKLEWDVDEKNKWLLPLIICGGVGGVALLLLGVFCWRKQAKKEQQEVMQQDDESV